MAYNYRSPFIRQVKKNFVATTALYRSIPYRLGSGVYISLNLPIAGPELTIDDWLCAEYSVTDNFFTINRSNFPEMRGGVSKSLGFYAHEIAQAAHLLALRAAPYDLSAYMPPNVYDSMFPFGTYGNTSEAHLSTGYSSISVYKDETIKDIYLVDLQSWELGTQLICLNPYNNFRIVVEDTTKINKTVCECGAVKVNSPHHSAWCPLK